MEWASRSRAKACRNLPMLGKVVLLGGAGICPVRRVQGQHISDNPELATVGPLARALRRAGASGLCAPSPRAAHS